jgi:hypothetical protein
LGAVTKPTVRLGVEVVGLLRSEGTASPVMATTKDPPSPAPARGAFVGRPSPLRRMPRQVRSANQAPSNQPVGGARTRPPTTRVNVIASSSRRRCRAPGYPAYSYGYGYPAYSYGYGPAYGYASSGYGAGPEGYASYGYGYPAYSYASYGYPGYGYGGGYYRPAYRSVYYGGYRPAYRPAVYGGYRVARRVAIHRARWR